MDKLANAFALLGDEEDKDASTIVAVRTAEAKKITVEHKKIVAEQKKIDAEQKKIVAEQKKIDAEKKNDQQRNGRSDHQVLSKEESHMRWLANRERWLANRERWLAREAEKNQRRLAREVEKNKDMSLKTLKEYEAEQKALEKNNKSDKSTVSVPEKEATLDNFTTKQKSNKNGPAARGMDSQDSRKNLNNRSWAGYSKHNKDNALPDVKVKAEPAPAPAPDFSETNFPVLGKVTKPTKSSVKHIRKDNTH
ncbi:hypothetical protein POM88_006626 [Heracleum sosnowskyi]|uniref:STM1-like N-terminal domain-containing protein n=1 Tax=Heracleum sosnowskyi TaxID=360622 RepID=A0AAD8J570_9APIA|nr:hypothetical protein POM88_006626 [Heracleum sosnowskyi]